MQTIYLIDDEQNLKQELTDYFAEEKLYKFKQIKKENIDVALRDIPALIIINEDTIEENVPALCAKIRSNDDNAITPIIVISSNIDKKHRIEILEAQATYFRL